MVFKISFIPSAPRASLEAPCSLRLSKPERSTKVISLPERLESVKPGNSGLILSFNSILVSLPSTIILKEFPLIKESTSLPASCSARAPSTSPSVLPLFSLSMPCSTAVLFAKNLLPLCARKAIATAAPATPKNNLMLWLCFLILSITPATRPFFLSFSESLGSASESFGLPFGSASESFGLPFGSASGSLGLPFGSTAGSFESLLGSTSGSPLGLSPDSPSGLPSGVSSLLVILAATSPILSLTVGSNFSIVSSPVSTLNLLKNEPSTPFICSPL